ncbi:DUF2029 domain-containing protein [Phormidium tenue FACHB-886]|nr:DUF2029 domain-containing protein [Phormidium tenue FACHB-886]
MNMIKSKFVNSAFVVFLPIVYIIVYLLIGNQKGPYYWTPNQDPDYAYLANSLVLTLFRVPSHTDHPGTPLQMLGALTIWVGHFFRSLFNPALPRDVATDVLTDPEPFLHLFNFVLLLLTAIALVALGWVAYRLSRSLILVLILQISPFLMIKTHLGGEPSRVSPDVLVFCISQLLALVLVQHLYTENGGKLRGFALRLGAVFGLGMATKVTFIPMFLFFLLPRGWKNKAWALGAAIVAFVISTLPIISRYNRTFRWMTGIATHTGAYGGGDAGLVATDSLGRNIYLLVTRNLVFFGILLTATIVALVIAALWRRWGSAEESGRQAEPADELADSQPRFHLRSPHFRKTYALLVITTLVMWGQVALTVNEQPQSRYLDPSAGLMGFLVFLLVQIGLAIGSTTGSRFVPKVNVAVPAIALALCVLLSAQQADASIDQIAPQAKKRAAELNRIEKILERDQYRSCARLLSRRASTIESALKFADFWAGKKLATRLQPLYPNSAFYIDENKSFESFTEPVSLETMAQRGNGCVLLEINAVPPQSKKARFRPQQALEKVFEGRHEAVYRIKTS